MTAFWAYPARCGQPLNNGAMGAAGLLAAGEEQLLELEW